MSAYDDQVIARSGVETYFPCSESSGTPTDVVGGKTLVAVGSPTPGGPALLAGLTASVAFTASDMYTLAEQLIADLTSDWSLIFTIEWDTGASAKSIYMSLGPWSGIVGPGTGVFFYNVNGTTYGYVNGNTSTQFTAVEDTTPYHFGARYKSATNELTLFIDGGAEVTADAGATSNLAGSFIGNTTAQDSGYGFVGYISNIAGYGVDIGDGEFAADYAAAISSGPPPPPAPATRSQILDANMTWAADDFVATAGTGAIAGYSIYVGYNGTWVLAPTGELMQTYSILSTVELTGYSAAALAAALIAAIDDGQPHTGPF